MNTRSSKPRWSHNDLPMVRDNEKRGNAMTAISSDYGMTKSASMLEVNELKRAQKPLVNRFVTEINKNGYFIIDGYTDDYSNLQNQHIKTIKREMTVDHNQPAIFNSESLNNLGKLTFKTKTQIKNRLISEVDENGESSLMDDCFR
jgi:hypothetical protein